MRVWHHPRRRFPKTRFELQKKQFERRSLEEGDPSALGSLVSKLEAGIGLKKESWPIPLLRVLSDVLLEVAAGRKLSAPHEARWLNLLGFCLRPGFGDAQDGQRTNLTRKLYQAGLAFPE